MFFAPFPGRALLAVTTSILNLTSRPVLASHCQPTSEAVGVIAESLNVFAKQSSTVSCQLKTLAKRLTAKIDRRKSSSADNHRGQCADWNALFAADSRRAHTRSQAAAKPDFQLKLTAWLALSSARSRR
jgi:hypothetical protein